MKSTAVWVLVILNVVLLGALVGRNMKPNAAIAQGTAAGSARPGDYTIIPVDFPGAPTGFVVVLDNVSGQMTAIATNEATGRMEAIPRVNVSNLFDAAAGRPRTPPRR